MPNDLQCCVSATVFRNGQAVANFQSEKDRNKGLSFSESPSASTYTLSELMVAQLDRGNSNIQFKEFEYAVKLVLKIIDPDFIEAEHNLARAALRQRLAPPAPHPTS
jgi:hypothetical protein